MNRYRAGEAEALNGLGDALLAAGQAAQARAHYAAALVLASQIGDKHEQARARAELDSRACAADPQVRPAMA